jgi:hypothetical protein
MLRSRKNKAAAKAVDEFIPAGALPAWALSLQRQKDYRRNLLSLSLAACS